MILITFNSDADEPTNQKKSKDKSSIKTIESKVDDMKEDMESIKKDIWHLNETSMVPMTLQRIIRDTFQCKICVMMSKCCKVIIGCETCVNWWYTGSEIPTKTCESVPLSVGTARQWFLDDWIVFFERLRRSYRLKKKGTLKSYHIWFRVNFVILLN